jgi:GNAT superfamily N-acetyltransferase
VILPVGYDDPRARALLDALAEYYTATYGAHDLDDDPADYRPPTGGCLVGFEDETPVAVACWRHHEGAVCELRRFYVDPTARGRRWGRRLDAVLSSAAVNGYERAVCATAAGGVLAGLDVRRIAPYGPCTDMPGVGCYELRLSGNEGPAQLGGRRMAAQRL